MYLQAAARVLVQGPWRFVREIVDGPDAALEFETEVEGLTVNGIDLITFDPEGRIVDFKVMVRPFRALQILEEKMVQELPRE